MFFKTMYLILKLHVSNTLFADVYISSRIRPVDNVVPTFRD